MNSLEKRLETLESRVLQMERMLKIQDTPPPAPAVPLKPSYSRSPFENTPEVAKEKTDPARLLGLIAVLCFVFAAIYIVKLAIDSGWLTPARQVILSGTFGLTLIGLGFLFKKRDHEYFSYLPAAGIVVLFVSVFGATNFYHLIPFEIGAVGCIAIAAACLLLYEEFKFGIYQIIAAVGAYLLPLYMGTGETVFTHIYFVIASLMFTSMAIWLDLRPVSLLSAYLAIAVTSMCGASEKERGMFIMIQFAIFAMGAIVHSVKRKVALTKTEALGFFPLILFFYAVEYACIDRMYPAAAPFFSLSLSALLLAMYFGAKMALRSETVLASGNMIFTSVTVILVHSIYFVCLAPEFKPVGLLIMAAAFYQFRNRLPANWNLFNGVLKILIFCLFTWNYFEIAFGQFGPDNRFDIINGFLFGCALIFLSVNESHTKEPVLRGDFLLILAHAISILSLYSAVKSWGSLAVSCVWAVYALAVLGYGYRSRDKLFAKSSLVVLLISAGKALVYDTSEAAAPVRVICLVLTGGLLYFSGYIFRKIEAWRASIS